MHWGCEGEDVPTPVSLPVPPPARVVMMLVVNITTRILLFPTSAMYTFPDASKLTAVGALSCALVAAPPSPPPPAVPLPTAV